MKRLSVELTGKNRSYPIIIERGILNRPEIIKEALPQKNICVVSNQQIFDLYGKKLQEALPERNLITVILPEGEAHKNLNSFSQILDAMLNARFGRDAVVVALGGGVVGDIAGFVASAFQRGVACVQIPTTLLAQVDSSVGGKTGVNHACGKNLIGAFHQPSAVLIDPDTLKSLPSREFSAGMAEVIKYALINDFELFEILENKETLDLTAVIARCCQNKADIVASDETEQGARALLNLGHTFGHALEALTEYKRFNHGECVAMGTVCALRLSLLLEKISVEECNRAVQLFRLYGLPTEIPSDLDPVKIYRLMWGDKKVQAGKLRLILQKRFCESEIVSDVPEDLIILSIINSLAG